MSWFNKTDCDQECEKRKTLAFEFVLKSFEMRRNAVLATNPSAIIQIYHNANGSNEFIAYDESGHTILAKEIQWIRN